jgi:twitching motility protein PilT
MLATSAIRNLIREGKTHQLDNVINTAGDVGMVPLDKSLADLVRSKDIELNDAMKMSLKQGDLRRYLETQ